MHLYQNGGQQNAQNDQRRECCFASLHGLSRLHSFILLKIRVSLEHPWSGRVITLRPCSENPDASDD